MVASEPLKTLPERKTIKKIQWFEFIKMIYFHKNLPILALALKFNSLILGFWFLAFAQWFGSERIKSCTA